MSVVVCAYDLIEGGGMFRSVTQGFVMVQNKQTRRLAVLRLLLAVVSGLPFASVAGDWEPERPVEMIVPARAGSDLDQRARLMQDIIVKHKLMKQPLVLVNKSGGAGAEGFLAVKNSRGDAHQLLIVDNSLFTVPMFTGLPFNWKDTSPVAMVALEQFLLWTNAQKGYKSANEYIEAAKAAGPGIFKMGGTGAGFPDQILTLALGGVVGSTFNYVPLKSTEVAAQLALRSLDSTVNNPVEALIHWRSGVLTPQCVFDDERMPYKAKVTKDRSWNDIPTCREAGIPVDYQMLLGILMPLGVTLDQVDYFIEVFRMMTATPEWRSYMENGAFEQTFRTASAFTDWLVQTEIFHQVQMGRRLTRR